MHPRFAALLAYLRLARNLSDARPPAPPPAPGRSSLPDPSGEFTSAASLTGLSPSDRGRHAAAGRWGGKQPTGVVIDDEIEEPGVLAVGALYDAGLLPTTAERFDRPIHGGYPGSIIPPLLPAGVSFFATGPDSPVFTHDPKVNIDVRKEILKLRVEYGNRHGVIPGLRVGEHLIEPPRFARPNHGFDRGHASSVPAMQENIRVSDRARQQAFVGVDYGREEPVTVPSATALTLAGHLLASYPHLSEDNWPYETKVIGLVELARTIDACPWGTCGTPAR